MVGTMPRAVFTIAAVTFMACGARNSFDENSVGAVTDTAPDGAATASADAAQADGQQGAATDAAVQGLTCTGVGGVCLTSIGPEAGPVQCAEIGPQSCPQTPGGPVTCCLRR